MAISGLGGSEWPVIVAMVPMRVMKTAVNEVIDMVSMRNRLVAAAWAVTVSITANLGCAFDGVGTADVDDVLVDGQRLFQIARENLGAPQGVGVIIEARHLCMQMRGVEKQHGQAVTSAMLGAFRHNKQTRDEFLALVRRKG